MARRRKTGGKSARTEAGGSSSKAPNRPASSLICYVAAGLILCALALGAAWLLRRPANKVSIASASASAEALPTVWQLLAMPAKERETVDIPLVNLRCAEGLRGSENLHVPAALQRLNEFARRVESETNRHLPRFRANPAQYENSEAYFRLLMLAVVAQEDFKIGYNPKRASAPGVFSPNEVFYSNAKDIFLHGLTAPPMQGTCSSLPVFYVAVGRRLGYPLYLVSTKNHLFVRWDDGRTRLNMEATVKGLVCDEDEHYRKWPYLVSKEEEEANGYLRSMTPQEELSSFLAMRAACLMSSRRYTQAAEAYKTAANLSPHIRGLRWSAEFAEQEAQRKMADLVTRQIDQIKFLLDGTVPPSAIEKGMRRPF